MSPNSPITQSPKNLRVAFLGTPRIAQIVLENLLDSPYKPSLVITAPDGKMGRGQKEQASPVKKTALEHNIETRTDLAAIIQDTRSVLDLAILVAYGQLIPKEILQIPKYGFINIHPSLLPKYRGPSPIQTAILEGEKETGVTIMKLDEKLDHGPTIAQRKVPIEPNDTHLTLVEKLGAIGSNLLLEALPDYISGKITPKPQDHSKATHTKKITKQDGFIDLQRHHTLPNPLNLDRMIRAFYPWPTVWTKVDGTVIKLLPQKMVQPEGKKPITFEEFKNGYGKIALQLKALQ